MPDYEDMILARQELVEIFEDDPDIYESLIDGGYLRKMISWIYGYGEQTNGYLFR